MTTADAPQASLRVPSALSKLLMRTRRGMAYRFNRKGVETYDCVKKAIEEIRKNGGKVPAAENMAVRCILGGTTLLLGCLKSPDTDRFLLGRPATIEITPLSKGGFDLDAKIYTLHKNTRPILTSWGIVEVESPCADKSSWNIWDAKEYKERGHCKVFSYEGLIKALQAPLREAADQMAVAKVKSTQTVFE